MGYLNTLEQRRLPRAGTALAVALAFAHAGDGPGAERQLALARSLLEARGVAGIHLGRCHEIGARIAIRRRDAAAFAERAAACAKYYRCGENPVLTARHDALLRANLASRRPGASSEDSVFTQIVVPQHATGTLRSDSGSELEMISSAHESVLTALIAESGATGGFLYMKSGLGLCRVFGTSGLEVPGDLDADVADYLAHALEPDTIAAECLSETKQRPVLESRTGQRFIACLLEEGLGVGLERVAGVAVLAVADGANVEVSMTRRAAAARALMPLTAERSN
jgi:hypothetical protein